MDQVVSWVATGATILAACMTASNLGARITGYGFIVFVIASLAWTATGVLSGQPALVWTNVVMTFLNLFGVWRWLGRQAKVEDGAQKAAEESRSLPTETLFPASALGSAKLVGPEGDDLGSCVDAMFGCSSGRLTYLVVAEGGLAGVGETFRRLEWSDAGIHGGTVRTRLDGPSFAALPQLAKDDWPGR